MHRFLPRLIPAAALLAMACGPMLHYERAPDIRLHSGDGWAWGAPDGDGLTLREGALIPDDSIARAISDAIEQELTSRGFPRVRAESAQFLLHFHVAQRVVTDTVPPPDDRVGPDGVRTPGRWGGYGNPEDVMSRTFTWEEGMLIVDAVVPRTGIVAWRGMIAGEVSERARSAPAPAVREAVTRLLRGFP